MRLINSTTYELENFSGNIPEYAILSHTWGKKELSFQDLQKGDTKHTAEFAKLQGCCKQARIDSFGYIWIDTCCIDKSSSAELSEAINSMYKWYKEAQVCYAYLADVPSGENPKSVDSSFANSRWFERGWTLQELIAPTSLVFYDKDWNGIGTRLSLQKKVSEITGIPIIVLRFGGIKNFSVAQRMSWASNRQTTRIEDKAYCLMGLFDVNMPMLYGEGERAFRRLQEEIMKTSDDHTLFAWTEPTRGRRWITRGLLADSPAEFADSGAIVKSDPFMKSAPYSMTNKGLRIELPLFPIDDQMHLAVLNCRTLSDSNGQLGIYLKQLPSEKEECFARIFPDEIEPLSKEKAEQSKQRTLYIIQENEGPKAQELGNLRLFRISLVRIALRLSEAEFSIGEVYSVSKEWKRLGDDTFRFVGRQTGVLGVLLFVHPHANVMDFLVVLGHYQGLPWCDIVINTENKSLARVYSSYLGESLEDRVDQTYKTLQAGTTLFAAVRKKGRRQRASESDYDGEYNLMVAYWRN